LDTLPRKASTPFQTCFLLTPPLSAASNHVTRAEEVIDTASWSPSLRPIDVTLGLNDTDYFDDRSPPWLLTPLSQSPIRGQQSPSYAESPCHSRWTKQRWLEQDSRVELVDSWDSRSSEHVVSSTSTRSRRSRIPRRRVSKTATFSPERSDVKRLPHLIGPLAYLDGCAEERSASHNAGRAHSICPVDSSNEDKSPHPEDTLDSQNDSNSLDDIRSAIVPADDLTPIATATPAMGGFPFLNHQPTALSPLSPRRSQSCFAKCTSPSPKASRNRIQTPDRFVPTRILRSPSRDAFMMTQSPSKLSAVERKERQQTSISDPFAPRIRVPPQPSERPSRSRLPMPSRAPIYSPTRLRAQTTPINAATDRNISYGGVWRIGGSEVVNDGMHSISNGRGGRIASGTNAPLHVADFFSQDEPVTDDRVVYQRRLAAAFDLDPANRMFGSPGSPSTGTPPTLRRSAISSPVRLRSGSVQSSVSWKNSAWVRDQPLSPKKMPAKRRKCVPVIPFRVLDAPAFRDDFYCSLLAYSRTAQCLAVGLGTHVYLWSESRGVDTPRSLSSTLAGHITSLSFSSTEGGHAILAIGRSDGRVTLWSPLDAEPRFDSEQPSSVSCLAFSPRTNSRYSVRHDSVKIAAELLVIGDEAGHIYVYAVEWPTTEERDLYDWPGAMTLVARLTAHTQQVCGLAWSPDNTHFASGGNDNSVYIFETKKIISPSVNRRHTANSDNSLVVRHTDSYTPMSYPDHTSNRQSPVPSLPASAARHYLPHSAAVKALAFAPWQSTLLACGAGSNDRGIHFYHTLSGTKLAAIDCSAQVTSLV